MDLVIYDNYGQCSHSGGIQYVKYRDRKQTWDSLENVVSRLRPKQEWTQSTLFDATGLAIEDVATGRYIYEKAIKSEQYN